MNTAVKEQILQKIKAYRRIMLFRHVRPDGDCVGATKGLKQILQLSFPEKEILLVDENSTPSLAFLGPDDGEVADEIYAGALAIVLDTATAPRISNQKYRLCSEVIKIDHHIPVDDYGHINWVEHTRSSASEMVVDFYCTFKEELKLDKTAALYLYTGMITDSGRFRYSGVNGETMRCAGLLLDQGIDTENLYAHLYLDDYQYLKFKAQLYENMNITENGVAYVHITAEMQELYHLTDEDAGNSVSTMETIRGCLCWMAFIDNRNEIGTIRVRIRSRFMPINTLAEKYHGGGHANASGATVYSSQEMAQLIRDADELTRKFKQTNTDWI